MAGLVTESVRCSRCGKQADLPANIVLVTEPDYKITNLYGLRWDAPQETAYPSTFILDKKGMVLFEKISRGPAIACQRNKP